MEYEQSPRVQVWAICDSFVLVDALHPAATAFVVAAEQGQSLDASLAAIVAPARHGRASGWGYHSSQIGRAAWVGERTENQPDPGNVLVVHLLETVAGVEHTAPGRTLT